MEEGLQKEKACQVQVIKLPIHRLFPRMEVFIYFIDGLLIDTGPRFHRSQLAHLYKELNISKVAITHLHKDHSGMVPWISKNLQVPIYANKKAFRVSTITDAFFTNFITDMLNDYPTELTSDNYTFVPIETPGHTRDHMCLLEPQEGWLFTGDLYITPQPKVSLRTESFAHYISSIKQVLTLDFEKIFCAHQGVIQNGHKLLTEKLEYLEDIQFQVVRLYGQGLSERQIAKQLFPKKAKLERLSFGMFSSLHLVRSCLKAYHKQL